LVEATRAALPDLPEQSFYAEPSARNTAPCIAWGTAKIARENPDAVVMVLPSDQHIGQPDRYLDVLRRAIASAEGGTITTVGIVPTRPETGYGYIEVGSPQANGVHSVERFVEKPDVVTAQKYLESGRFWWNSGMFFFRASAMLDAVKRHLPELWSGIREVEQAAERGAEAEQLATERLFETTDSVSIDYGVMERESRLHVVPGDFGWSDLGSWESDWELGNKDGRDNVADPGTILVDARNNLVRDLRKGADSKTIALLGVEGLCVIETDDALLVMPRERAQDVRQVVDELKQRGDKDKL
jgi:mannose-1-phosphate guanylyltransferase